MMDIQIICSDIDGTLLDKNRAISAETAAAVQKIRDHIPFLLVSSRMPASMELLQDDLGTGRLPLICYNGALVIHYPDGKNPEVLLSDAIDAHIILEIARQCEREDVHVSLYQGEEWYVPGMDYWAKREENNTRVSPSVDAPGQVAERWKAQGGGAHKVMLMGEKEKIDRLYAFLEKNFSGDLHIYRSRDTYIEIASKRISKASGIQKALELYPGLSLRQVMSFGDNYNDVDMLQSSGIGIAVANAKPEVLEIADEITLTNKEHGVAVSLDKYFEKSSF